MDREYHNEDTLFKVRNALVQSGLEEKQAEDAITAILSAGMVFRERGIE